MRKAQGNISERRENKEKRIESVSAFSGIDIIFSEIKEMFTVGAATCRPSFPSAQNTSERVCPPPRGGWQNRKVLSGGVTPSVSYADSHLRWPSPLSLRDISPFYGESPSVREPKSPPCLKGDVRTADRGIIPTNPPKAAQILFSIHFYLFSQNRRYRFSSLFTFPYLFLLKKTHNNVIIKIGTNADNNFIPYHTKQTQGGNQNERNIKSQRA